VSQAVCCGARCCNIGGFGCVRPEDPDNPMNSCLTCDPSVDQFDWTRKDTAECAGDVDGGPAAMDAGPADTGPGEEDAGPMGEDAGPAEVDSGPAAVDSGPSGTDSGAGGMDSGPSGADAGSPPDDDGGCSVGGTSPASAGFALLALGVVMRRRRTR
jgi:MYXO-CTERM domain-containing protein